MARKSCVWVGVVGPDGSGKSTLAGHLIEELRARGFTVAHTHGRPQSLAARRSSPAADHTTPHAGAPRSTALSLAKYFLAAADFAVSRRRFDATVDFWISERPLLDYQVDPARYQLSPAAVRIIRNLNRYLGLPNALLLLDGNAAEMAGRKLELGAAEIDRQLREWRRIDRSGRIPSHRVTTTGDSAPAQLALDAAQLLAARPREPWRRAPVKPGRLDVRFAGTDLAALDIYRPINPLPRMVAFLGRLLTAARLSRRVPVPDPGIETVLDELRAEGETFSGISGMASSAQDRWVFGLARAGRLRLVLKMGTHDDVGLSRERANLQFLHRSPIPGLATPHPRVVASPTRREIVVTHAQEGLSSVTDVDRAIEAAAALAGTGWTHGDLTPWNLFAGRDGRLHLLDWEEADRALRPLADITHFLLRLGSTTHPADGRAGLDQLVAAHPRFGPLFKASGVPLGPDAASPLIREHLRRTTAKVMSDRERELRRALLHTVSHSAT